MPKYVDRPLKAALDYARDANTAGGFWVNLKLRDGRSLVGAVEDHRYRDEVVLLVYDAALQGTGERVAVAGRDVLSVDLDGEVIYLPEAPDDLVWARAVPGAPGVRGPGAETVPGRTAVPRFMQFTADELGVLADGLGLAADADDSGGVPSRLRAECVAVMARREGRG